MKKFLIITTIFPPTEAIKKFSEILRDWTIVVVGDKKTPSSWQYEKQNIIFLDVKSQLNLGLDIAKAVPFNSYTRKNIGYLYAIKNGADLIAESDDDNIPYGYWEKFDSFETKLIKGKGFINIYSLFTQEKIWPRGFPLDLINSDHNFEIVNSSLDKKIGIYQLLADKEPDVDAIYRLIINKEVFFAKDKGFILDKGVYCPFNSQNTIFIRETFPLLYLPSFVSIRATDIYRGLIAQAILQKSDFYLYFGSPTVFQERNPHNYMKDFQDEIEVYLNSSRIIEILSRLDFKWNKFDENLKKAYRVLVKEGIMKPKEYELVELWLKDIKLKV